jgi:cell division protein FtsQ
MSEARADDAGGSGTTTAPVYLRLQKRAEAESRRPRTSKESVLFRSLSIAFLVLVCVSCMAWIVARYLDHAPRFQLHSVELRSATHVSAAKVEAIFKSDREKSVYDIPLDERREEIERIPWVHTATVTRVLPDRISVAVRERQPVAFLWTRRGVVLVDGEGVILETPKDVSWTFPVIRGVSEREPAEKRKQRMERYLALADALRSEAGALPEEISEVDLSSPQNVVVVVADSVGAMKLQLGNELFGERFGIYRSNIEGWRQQFAEIQSVDLRYEGQVVIQAGTPLTLPLDNKTGAALPATPVPQAEGPATAAPPEAQAGAPRTLASTSL